MERKRNDLDILDEELSNNPQSELLRDHIIHAQNEVGLIEENMQRVRDGTYHLRYFSGFYKSCGYATTVCCCCVRKKNKK